MPPDSPQLTILAEGRVQQTLTLTMDVLRVGRHPDNGLVLADREVSRDHAEFKRESSGFTLTDLGSTNGTFVNDKQLSPHVPYLLSSGDRIRMGTFSLVYQIGQRAQSAERGGEGKRIGQREVAAADTQVDERWGSRAIDLSSRSGRLPKPPRQAVPMPSAAGPTSRYLKYLPGIFTDDDFLGRYLLIVESLWEPLEQRQHFIDMYFDPRTAPASFLRWLGTWMGLAIEARWPERRCRELLSEAVDLYRFRGTLYGLRRMIEVVTGITPQIVDYGQEQDPKRRQPFVFRVRMRRSDEEGVDRELLEEIIDAHKPACAGYILELVP
jgi:phage tail-like protein